MTLCQWELWRNLLINTTNECLLLWSRCSPTRLHGSSMCWCYLVTNSTICIRTTLWIYATAVLLHVLSGKHRLLTIAIFSSWLHSFTVFVYTSIAVYTKRRSRTPRITLTDKKKKLVQESDEMPSSDWSVSRNNNSGLYAWMKTTMYVTQTHPMASWASFTEEQDFEETHPTGY